MLVSEDPNPLYRQNKESKSPWCIAVETGDVEVLKLLLEAPNDGEDQRRSESQRVFGMSPVHLAIMYQKTGNPCFHAPAYSLIFLVSLLFSSYRFPLAVQKSRFTSKV